MAKLGTNALCGQSFIVPLTAILACYLNLILHNRLQIFNNATTPSQKAGMGIGAALARWVLAHSGYVANAKQSAESIHGRLVFSALFGRQGVYPWRTSLSFMA